MWIRQSNLIVVRNIRLLGGCDWHRRPFFSRCSVGYWPDGTVLSLSALTRLVVSVSQRQQSQERLAVEIAEAVQSTLRPLGVGVLIEARYLGMGGCSRGGGRPTTLTSAMLGTFKSQRETREAFLRLALTM